MSRDPEVDELITILKELDPEERRRIHEAIYEKDKGVSERVRRNLSDFNDLTRLQETF